MLATAPQDLSLLTGYPAPLLDFDFVNGVYRQDGVGANSAISNFITTSRASVGYADDQLGNWTSFSANTARAVTPGGKGLLVEEARTNSIRNNSMQGAVVGTPGTAPLNWQINAGTGLTSSVTQLGTVNGIEFIAIRLAGTSGSTFSSIYTEATTQIAASNGQTWTESLFMGVAAGATNVNTVFPVIQQYAGGGGFLSALNGLNFLPSLGPTATTRIVNTQTTNNASTAFVRAGIQINYNSGVAVDITLLIGWPQLELGAFATSPIRTTNAAATRAADKATLTNPSTVTNVQTLGAQFVSLTNNGTPAILDVSDGTANNRNTLLVNSASGQNASGASVISAGAQNPRLDGSGPYIVNTLVKAAYASQPGQRAFASNGGVVSSSINMGTLTGLTTISIGTFGAGVAGFANAYIRRIMLWPTTYLSNISLQRLTL